MVAWSFANIPMNDLYPLKDGVEVLRRRRQMTVASEAHGPGGPSAHHGITGRQEKKKFTGAATSAQQPSVALTRYSLKFPPRPYRIHTSTTSMCDGRLIDCQESSSTSSSTDLQ
jgi:hypothetical protein